MQHWVFEIDDQLGAAGQLVFLLTAPILDWELNGFNLGAVRSPIENCESLHLQEPPMSSDAFRHGDNPKPAFPGKVPGNEPKSKIN